MTLSSLSVVLLGAVIPNSALGASLGFSPLPPLYFLALFAMTVIYLGCVELAKRSFYRKSHLVRRPISKPTRNRVIDRRATVFSAVAKKIKPAEHKPRLGDKA
jgi:Mg2+-importing ATPase